MAINNMERKRLAELEAKKQAREEKKMAEEAKKAAQASKEEVKDANRERSPSS